jgi:hypothetical protein
MSVIECSSTTLLHTSSAVPPSEFRDLVDEIVRVNVASTHVFGELALLQCRIQELALGSREQQGITVRILSMASDLERQYQKLDTHYGWVLASDHAHVSRVLCSYFGEDEAERWLGWVNAEMAESRSTLREIFERFR